MDSSTNKQGENSGTCPPLSILRNELTLSSGKASFEIRNEQGSELKVRLTVSGNPSVTIPKQFQEITIPAAGIRRVPVIIREVAPRKTWPIVRRAKQHSLIQIWSAEKGRKLLLDSVPVTQRGPVFVDELRCFHPDNDDGPKAAKGNSPPEITMTAYEPGSTTAKNTGTVELSWTVVGADELYDLWSHVGAEVLEPGTFTDAGGDTSSGHVTPTSETITYTAGATLNVALFAENDDGQVWDSETIYHSAPVGYHDAKCPAGGTIYTTQLDDVRGMLDEIDTLLRADRLTDLPAFITRWNEAAPPEFTVDEALPDLAYLSGSVGSGNLADDMLVAMQRILVYLHAHTMPRTFRPGTIPAGSDRRPLCDGGRVFGKSTRHWVAICYDIGADSLTLAHELFHYASTSHNDDERRAVLISWALFDDIPF